MTPLRVACPHCQKFNVHIAEGTFRDNARNHNGITEILHIHCDNCTHDFTLQIG